MLKVKSVKIFIDDITQPWGTERAVVNLANNLDRHGYQVSIVSSYSSSGLPAFPVNVAVDVKHLDVRQKSADLGHVSKMVQLSQLRSALKKSISSGGEILIGTNSILNSLLASLRIRRTIPDKLMIGCEHLPYDFGTRFVKSLRRAFYRRLDRIVLLTKADELMYNLAGFSNTLVIPNEAPEPVNVFKTQQKLFVAVGRLSEQKGFDILIRDMSPLLKEFPDWILEIYGDGEMYPELSRLIKSEHVEGNILLKGRVESIKDAYRRASAYLMSSRFEGLPMVLLEAQACGLPIVAYDCETGPREVIQHGQNGYLIPPGHSDEFRDAVRKIMLDSELRDRMRRNALESSKRFGSEAIFKQWQALLDRKS